MEHGQITVGRSTGGRDTGCVTRCGQAAWLTQESEEKGAVVGQGVLAGQLGQEGFWPTGGLEREMICLFFLILFEF
jgi:hypothetical protein